VHESLLRYAASHDLFYLYDTIPSALVKPTSAKEHRDLLANCAKRSRFFVTYEAKHGNAESRGQREVGARYYEGAAAGAVLLGRGPGVSSFREDFPWPDPVVEVELDGSDVAGILDRWADRPDDLQRMGRRNALNALGRHDWGHRWRSLLQLAGMVARPALERRLESLEALRNGVLAYGCDVETPP
jgi:hypothetical protein